MPIRTLASQPEVLDRASRLHQALLRRMARIPYLPAPRKYNLTISHQRKFLWYRVAKNGSRTIFNHLKTAGVALGAEHPYNVRYSPAAYRDYFKFAFVRNPWDRLVSCWVNKVVDKKGVNFNFTADENERMSRFDAFIDYVASLDINECNFHLRAQCALIDLENVDYLGRLETFADDFGHVCRTLGIPGENVVNQNVTRRQEYHQYYTPELAAKVARIYGKDVQVFGYRF